MGVKAAAGTGDQINRNRGFVHIRVRRPQLFYLLCNQLLIFLAGGGKIDGAAYIRVLPSSS